MGTISVSTSGPRRLLFYKSIRSLGGSMDTSELDAEVIDRDRIEVFVSIFDA